MKDTSEIVACVVDFGMVGVPMAERLSRGFKKVYLFGEWQEDYSTLNKYIQGCGFDKFERVHDLESIEEECDLFVFPDVQRAPLQLRLEKAGKAVWGSRAGDEYELDREKFLKALKETGLDVPPHEIVVGVNKLKDFLRDKEDFYIKVSRFRGSFETSHFRDWKHDERWLDGLAVRFGLAGDMIRFLCFPNVKTDIEIGSDTYCVDGQWPSRMLHGVEYKDKCYLGCVTNLTEMPAQARKVLKAFGPLLAKERYRNQFSSEIRVKPPKAYFIDATCRFGLPSTPSQLELWTNWPEIVWHGANGILVDPKPKAKFSAEALVTCKGDAGEWRTAQVPKELSPYLKLADCCLIDGLHCFPPCDSDDSVGWLVALGNTPEEAIRNLNENADMLPDGMDAAVEWLPYLLKEIATMHKLGIKFGDGPVPKPAVAVAS